MHFGATDPDTDRADEDALIQCLTAQREQATTVDHLYLLGDVFDGYLEYDRLVPKGQVRFLGLLAQWADDGIPITYLIGNHDPWHRDYFEQEIGVRVTESVDTRYEGRRLHLEHGDAVGSTHGLYSALRPWLRHPVPVWLYRSLLPADVGLGLARWVSEAVREREADPVLVAALDTYARRLLAGPTDLVVMGHSHVPVLRTHSVPQAPDPHALDADALDASSPAGHPADAYTEEPPDAPPCGAYLNTGNWFDARTFGRLDGDGLHLLRWNGTRGVGIEATTL